MLICGAVAAGVCLWPAGALAKTGGVSEFERTIAIARSLDSAGLRETAGTALRASSRRAGVLTLRSQRGFDLVGFRWSRGTPRIELQSYGAHGWSRWTRVDTTSDDRPDIGPLTHEHEGGARNVSGPVWTGRSSRLRIRVRAAAGTKLTAHFVKVSTGLARPAARRLRAADAPLAPLAPPIVTRAQWDADVFCKPRARPAYGEVQAVVVHHTASTNAYTQAEAPAVVLAICRFHRNSNGWNDIGYNLLVDRFGTIYEGRSGGVDRAVIGAHAQGYNGQTAGIALIGTFTNTAPPAATLDALRVVVRWKLALAGITRNERIPLISTGGRLNRFKYGRTVFIRVVSGHRDLGSTSCPGNGLFALLPGLAGYLDQSPRRATRMTLRLSRLRAPDGGQSVRVRGRLRAGGAAVAGELVQIQAFDDTVGWMKIGAARSNAAGLWQAIVRPARRQFVRGAFAGDAALRAGRSLWLLTPKLRRPPVAGSALHRSALPGAVRLGDQRQPPVSPR